MSGKDTKITIVTPQLSRVYRTGGIGTFCDHFIDLLYYNHYHDVTVIYTTMYDQPKKDWQPHYTARGIKVLTVYEPNQDIIYPPGYPPYVRVSEIVDELIPAGTEVVYFMDFIANGYVPNRRRRFRHEKTPATASVLHGPTGWHRQGQKAWPDKWSDLQLDYSERYAVEQSDFVAAPSQYILDWATENGWQLPPKERQAVLGYPWIRPPDYQPEAAPPPADRFKRVAFFGRLETRKGFDLFVNALLELHDDPCLSSLEEIVLLGQQGVHLYGTLAPIMEVLQQKLGIPVTAYTTYNSHEAQAYLREHVSDTLVVIPSRVDNFPFAVIETLLIPGLNGIFSTAGGIPEILEKAGRGQLFNPELRALTQKLREWLAHGPLPADQLARYDGEFFNAKWLAFHEQVVALTHDANRAAPQETPAPVIPRGKSVDVCVTNYNLGKYLPYALESLANQTSDDFNVFVIDDGSTDPETLTVFQQMERQYKDRGWHFIAQENQGVCAARNLGAALGNAEFIVYMDADNIAAPNMIQRFIECIRVSGDDVLTCWMYMFVGEHSVYLGSKNSQVLLPPRLVYLPDGNYPVLNMIGNPYGDLNCIIRRSAFEAVGGFTMDYPKHINHEDRELFTILSLKGYSLDVISEFLFYYRFREDSRLRTTDAYDNEARVMRAYRDRLNALKLGELPALVQGLRSAVQEARVVSGSRYSSEDGSVLFEDQHDYLVNGVPWPTLLKAAWGKIIKHLKR